MTELLKVHLIETRWPIS